MFFERLVIALNLKKKLRFNNEVEFSKKNNKKNHGFFQSYLIF